MPKIRIERFDNGSNRCDDGYVRGGLRDRQTYSDDRQVLRTQREKDDCFDMYRSAEARGPCTVRKKISGRETPQLWFIASIITALGAFCMFVDSIFVTSMGVTLKVASFEILMSPSKAAGSMPSCAIYMSAIPLVFLVMFGLFAFMKDKAFEKASLILMAVPLFVIVVLVHWSNQILSYGADYMYSLSPGYAVLGEIGCSVALIIVVASRLVMEFVTEKKISFRRR